MTHSRYLFRPTSIVTTMIAALMAFMPSLHAAADTQPVGESASQESQEMDLTFLTAPLITSSGESQALADHMLPGRWTLVMIWSVTCHVCIHETPVMSDFHDANKESLATVVGLALDGNDSGAKVDAFGEANDMRFPTLIGEMVPVASAYMALTQESLRGTPTFMLFDPDGVLQGINPGPLRPQAVLEYIKNKS